MLAKLQKRLKIISKTSTAGCKDHPRGDVFTLHECTEKVNKGCTYTN